MDFDAMSDAGLNAHLRSGEVWNSGYDARVAGRVRDCNPYREESPNHARWDDGWLFADKEIQEERDQEGTAAGPSQ